MGAHFSIKVDDLMASMQAVPLNEMPRSTVSVSTEKVRMHNQKVFEEQRSKFCPDGKTTESAIKEIEKNKELSNRQKRKLIRKIKRKSWKYSKPSPFAISSATATKRVSLLPPTDQNGNVSVATLPMDQISVSLDRGSLSSDNDVKVDEKEDEGLIKKLKDKLMKVTAERDGLVKTVLGLTQENERLKVQLGVQGFSAQ